MERLYFIVNPTAGADRAGDAFKEVCTMLDEMNMDYSFDYTQYKGHATELAVDAVKRGEKYIVSVGGDGTLNEVAQGLVHTDSVLGVLPFGTGNDLAKALKIPTDPREALTILLLESPKAMDVGVANDRMFFNVSGFGFDVDVLLATDKYKKRFRGMIPYLLGIVHSLAHLRTLHLTIKDDGRVWDREALIIAVGIGTHFGGGMNVLPMSDPFDGLFDVCIVKKLGILKFIRLLPLFIKGRHAGLKEVEYFRTDHLEVTCPEHSLINYDGELSSDTPVTFRLLPGALNILVK
ncbi:MAG: diacylglycerol kinase family lipid kinase [Clostridia bacterium]|nr:diacylglycerol kinase family lipid kinase [Clostridia bacterium]